MDSDSKTQSEQLQELIFGYRFCEDCDLHKTRGRLVHGGGSADASVLVVLDRLSPKSNLTGGLLSGGEGAVLRGLVKTIGPRLDIPIKADYFWFTPVVVCPPPTPTNSFGDSEVLPLAKTCEWRACQKRLHQEIYIVEPKVIIACGATALKSLFVKTAPPITSVRGRMSEAEVQGMLVPYKLPLMTTHSMHELHRNRNDAALWSRILEHFTVAVNVAERLKALEEKADG